MKIQTTRKHITQESLDTLEIQDNDRRAIVISRRQVDTLIEMLKRFRHRTWRNKWGQRISIDQLDDTFIK